MKQKTATRDEMIAKLNAKYPELLTRTTEDFDGAKGGIWSSGESGITAKDDFNLFDYYSQDYRQKRYVLGVHKEIATLLANNGWYAEWYDAGTIMFWEK